MVLQIVFVRVPLQHHCDVADGMVVDYIIIIDNFCIALFSGVPKLNALYNMLHHFLTFTNMIHIIMTTNKCITYKYMCHMRSSNT